MHKDQTGGQIVMERFQQWVLVVFMLLCVAGQALAQTPPNFSGNFSFVPANAREAAMAVTLEIKQTPTTIQITRTVNGKPNVENYTTDGSPMERKTDTGIRIKASASWHGNELWLDSIATPSTNGHTTQVHSTEKWQLSKDGNMMMIRTELAIPNLPTPRVLTHDYKRSK